jgi:hypothetical protein
MKCQDLRILSGNHHEDMATLAKIPLKNPRLRKCAFASFQRHNFLRKQTTAEAKQLQPLVGVYRMRRYRSARGASRKMIGRLEGVYLQKVF